MAPLSTQPVVRPPVEQVKAWRLEVSATPPSSFLLRSPCRVGTHAGNELVLTEPTVSRLHAELTPVAEGVRVRDLSSRNGTFVDGVPVFDALAPDGARITLGRLVLTVKALVQEPLPPAAPFGELVGNSPQMRKLLDDARRLADKDTRVLIEAETGCGKELLARALHDHGPRAKGPLVVFDCGAVAASLIEGVLFGHERGAFTGADSAREGLLEAADGGTLFLDELGELPLELQPRLLRCLESGEVRRLGASTARKIDVRVISATHRNLLAAVGRGTFREDLYYRVAVVRLRIPPLRQRLDDLELLVRALLDRVVKDKKSARRTFDSITPAQWGSLREHPWPGNVRELKNVIERSLAIKGDDGLSLGSMPAVAVTGSPAQGARPDLEKPYIGQRDELLERFDREYLASLLARHAGNFTRAAAAAGIDRMYLKRLVRRYDLDP
jgi:transcriptional regulator with PAS, ATPase and Fis domain